MDPLEQLRVALEAFMAAGGDPAEAQAMMDEMAAGGGAPPPEGEMGGLGEMMPPPGEEGLEGELPPMDEEMPPPQPEAKTFDEANEGATKRLKKLNGR